jgi:hypothetical protein
VLKLMAWPTSLSGGRCSHVISNASSKIRNVYGWQAPTGASSATHRPDRTPGPGADRRGARPGNRGIVPPWPVKSIIIVIAQLVQIFVFERCP